MQQQRTLLLLGGSKQQVVAIEKAKECGYRTVLCDFLPDNPGQYVADKFYLVSTTDREAVLDVARRENVGGVIAYSSDPASPTAAYVAERLGLPTNPLRSVEIMSKKDLFRAHLRNSGLPCPQAISFDATASGVQVEGLSKGFQFPLVLKPTDSSGSKGVTVLRDCSQLPDAIDYARSFSRNNILIIEEYIEYGFPRVIGGDIFVVDGQVRFWGLMSCLRDGGSPLVPVGEMMPSGLSDEQYRQAKEVLSALVASLGIRFGELNVEIIMGADGRAYVLELGSRAGGNLIPVQLADASGIDLVKANVMCAMGEPPEDISWEPDGTCNLTFVLHSLKEGIFEGYELDPCISEYRYREVMYVASGSAVEPFSGANKALGVLFFKFSTMEQLMDFNDRFGDYVVVHIK